jgi:hypothetical protein
MLIFGERHLRTILAQYEARHLTKRYGKPYGGLTDPLRAVGALLDAKAVVGGRSAPTISGGWHRDA